MNYYIQVLKMNYYIQVLKMSYYIQVYIIIKISCILFCTMTSGMYRSTSYKCFHVQRQTTVQEKVQVFVE